MSTSYQCIILISPIIGTAITNKHYKSIFLI